MSVTRRCFLKFAGGATAGAVISPLPWKLLDDVSIWTQNGSWVAHPPTGPVSHLFNTCTLCPAGCGMRLRRVGDHTVSALGSAGHPLNEGHLCPAGLGVAQVPYHPARIRGTAARGLGPEDPWRLVDTQETLDMVGRRLAHLCAEGSADRVAVLDLRPGRSLSLLYGDFLEVVGGGRYLTLPGGREQSATALTDLFGVPGLEPGLDIAGAGAIISFGAPLFDGWAGGGPAPGLMQAGMAGKGPRPPYTVQVQTNGSANSGLADSWLPIRPGTEGELALGLAFILHENRNQWELGESRDIPIGPLLSNHTPDHVAKVTGISSKTLHATARDLAGQQVAVAVGGGSPGGGPLGRPEEYAIGILNLVLGNIGRPGGVVQRPDLATLFEEKSPTAQSIWDLPDHSLDLLIVDGSLPETPLPGGLLRRKMRGPDSLIVGLSPYVSGPTAVADVVVPTMAPGEWADDVPPRALSPIPTYAVASAVETSPKWSLHPADALGLLAESAGLGSRSHLTRSGHQEVMDRRIATLHARGQGTVFDPKTGESKDLVRVSSPRALKKTLTRGGCWTEAVAAAPRAPLSLESFKDLDVTTELASITNGRLPAKGNTHKNLPLVAMPGGPVVPSSGGILPTVVNKLYRESNLMPGAGSAWVNPTTARAQGIKEGREALLITENGSMTVTISFDESIMPGVVQVSSTPVPENLGDPANGRGDILEVCGAATGPVWRVERAALQEL